jgi:threonine dehydrogenase-like Zn-dependent dehydrogenase
MQAAHWNGQRLEFDPAYPTPQADAHTALVRVHLAGICSTDLQILQGYMGFTGVPGHEFVGEVTQGPAALLGRRVVGEINFACRQCPTCAKGLERHCPTRRVMGILQADGTFADYVAVPVANLHPVPATVSDEAAVFTEPLAAAFEILEQVHLKPTDDVVIFGDGKLGLLCAQVLQLTGARVHLAGRHPHKLALLRPHGIRTILLPDQPPGQADVVVEATGSAEGLQRAMETVRPRGTLVLKSTVAAAHHLSLAPLVIHEITVIGSRCGRFSPALQALANDHISVTPLIEHIYALTAVSDAVAHASRRGALKVLLSPRSSKAS